MGWVRPKVRGLVLPDVGVLGVWHHVGALPGLVAVLPDGEKDQGGRAGRVGITSGAESRLVGVMLPAGMIMSPGDGSSSCPKGGHWPICCAGGVESGRDAAGDTCWGGGAEDLSLVETGDSDRSAN